MNLKVKQEGAVLIFEVEGQLDFESTQLFQETCADIITKKDAKNVVFDFDGLKFVGSSGINQFIRALKDFNSSAEKPRLCAMSAEFTRMFKAYETQRNPFEIFETQNEAIASFAESRPGVPTKPAKKQFQRRKPGQSASTKKPRASN